MDALGQVRWWRKFRRVAALIVPLLRPGNAGTIGSDITSGHASVVGKQGPDTDTGSRSKREHSREPTRLPNQVLSRDIQGKCRSMTVAHMCPPFTAPWVGEGLARSHVSANVHVHDPM